MSSPELFFPQHCFFSMKNKRLGEMIEGAMVLIKDFLAKKEVGGREMKPV